MRWLLVLAALALWAGCEREGPPREPPPPDRPREQSQIPDQLQRLIGDASVSAADASAAASALTELRKSKLELSPRHAAAEQLAFGRGRLAQLATDQLVVRDTAKFAELARISLPAPRRVVELADGGLLAVGGDAVVRLEPRAKDPERYGRIPLFPESLVLADRRDARRIWVLHGFGSLLYRYGVGGDAGALETLEFLDLQGFDQGAFAALKDGSFLYTAGDKLRRFFHGGKRWELALPEGGRVWRLLTTRRIDQVWIGREGGTLELAEISAGGLRIVRAMKIGSAFDVASNDHELAVVEVESGEGARRWKLAVYDPSGKRRFEAALPGDPTPGAGEDWVGIVTRDKTLALSTYAPLVAVGGPGALSVWNTKSGARVHGP
jgi:predicted small lipoprotein YifL